MQNDGYKQPVEVQEVNKTLQVDGHNKSGAYGIVDEICRLEVVAKKY